MMSFARGKRNDDETQKHRVEVTITRTFHVLIYDHQTNK